MRLVTSVVGSIAEAWSEFRVHKGRVLLSLIGVAVAVAALTGVVAAGTIAQQSLTESFERQGGRPALLTISAPYDPTTGEPAPAAETFGDSVEQAMDRYGIEFWSRVQRPELTVRLPEGELYASATVIDPDYGPMHRISLTEGSWFSERDAERLAPAVLTDSVQWERLGSPDLRTHPTVRLGGSVETTGVVVGVVPGAIGCPDCFEVYLLADAYERLAAERGPTVADPYGGPGYEAWVPPEVADELSTRLASDLASGAGEGMVVDVYRNDYLAYGSANPLEPAQLVIGGIAGLVLLLGALGLLNMSLVTVRTRIREIGIRRSFGATAGRVFAGVLMESVVATLAAGVAGVALAVLLIRNPITAGFIAEAGIQDMPPFPLDAALLGLAASVAVGALAGLIPAFVAVRVKPIDAIRY